MSLDTRHAGQSTEIPDGRSRTSKGHPPSPTNPLPGDQEGRLRWLNCKLRRVKSMPRPEAYEGSMRLGRGRDSSRGTDRGHVLEAVRGRTPKALRTMRLWIISREQHRLDDDRDCPRTLHHCAQIQIVEVIDKQPVE